MTMFKDLYVTLAPRATGVCADSNVPVVPACNIFATYYNPIKAGCSIIVSTDCSAGCFGPPVFSPWTIGGTPIYGFGAVQPYGSLKEYLKSALAAEEAREKALEESQKPQTVSEVEMLEEKLKGALQELSIRKTELQQQKK
jgi:hypothetical protein